MINFYFADLAKLIFAFLVALSQPSARIEPPHAAMLNAGENIDGMTLTSGAADARPLWFYCSSKVSENIMSADCRVPQMPKLAIGHVFLGTDEILKNLDWSDLTWNLWIDSQPVNLDDFGTYDYVVPSMAAHPSLVREVFIKSTAWDVVLTDLKPGQHTIKGQVRSDTEFYKWNIKLVIEE